MHEMSIAMSLIDNLLTATTGHDVVRIEEVEVEVGVLQQIVPEALHMAFEAVTAGTLAEGARLRIREVPVEAECRACGKQFAAALDSYQCPQCGEADVRILAGKDIVLRTVVCQTQECSSPS
ncbi:MAG: hydrogenase maturation nickel metallochaperone HypA [Phycisphaerae bacterium]|jgi:hydrogenase nickel incorporation protein HypA/HybF